MICITTLHVVNDRNTLKWDSAETEASAKLTEASAEASAESLAKKIAQKRKFFQILIIHMGAIFKRIFKCRIPIDFQ